MIFLKCVVWWCCKITNTQIVHYKNECSSHYQCDGKCTRDPHTPCSPGAKPPGSIGSRGKPRAQLGPEGPLLDVWKRICQRSQNYYHTFWDWNYNRYLVYLLTKLGGGGYAHLAIDVPFLRKRPFWTFLHGLLAVLHNFYTVFLAIFTDLYQILATYVPTR